MRDDVVDDARPDIGSIEAGATLTQTWGEDTTADHRNVTTDTYVSGKNEIGEEEVDLNYGVSTQLDLDNDAYPLVRFDLSALPPTTRVVSASLRIMISGSQHGTIALHRMNEGWAEGTGNNTVGAASWNERLSGTPWSAPGIGAPASRDNEAAASIPANASGAQLVALPASLVESWIASPATNFGLVLVTQSGDDTRLTPREGTDGSRPSLEITYLP